MREIKFRGKNTRNNNEWVYGDLIQGECTYISTKEDFYDAVVSINGHLSTVVKIVDKNTLGQYTGLKDKNGNKIFEGDILEYEFEDIGKQRAFVYWNGKYASFTLEVISEDFEYTPVESGYIIGNIYDNPELLEEKI